jgi:hypothetical protein
MPFLIIVCGDEECPSDEWTKGEELVTAMVQREIISGDKNKHIRSVHHLGDISYMRREQHWDAWHGMIALYRLLDFWETCKQTYFWILIGTNDIGSDKCSAEGVVA